MSTPPPDAGPAPQPVPRAAHGHVPPVRPRPRAPTALVVLAVLAIGYTLWAAQGLILPVLLAMFFAMLGNPIIRLLQRLRVPRFVGALMVLVLGIYSAVSLGRELVAPAGEWMREIPREMRDIGPKLRKLTQPVQEASQAAENIARAAGGDADRKVEVVRTEADDPYKALTSTPKMVAAVLAVVLLTFFFMVYGASLQKNALALLPGRQQKKLTVEILQAIEREVSRYVLTISLINVLVGIVYALILHYALAVPADEALLWGTMATLLNFAPYVGPLIGIVAMLAMGLLSYDEFWQSMLPAAVYLGLHTLEGQIITPIVLGARMALSPLVLILALMLFGWLWGIVGLLLAVPLLVIVKIVLAKIEGLDGWARLLE
jgi:predicted PurR-regulated permease PerM